MEASERPTEGRVTEGHPSWYQESRITESGPSALYLFRRHISGGAIVAGTLVALALQFLFIAFGSFLHVGAGSVASLGDLNGIVTSIGIWVAASAAVATFVGAYMAARLAGTSLRNGLWHGLTTWGLVIVSGIVLGMFGFTGVLGFGLDATRLLTAYVPGIAPAAGDVTTAANIAHAMSGWFLIGVLASLVTGLFGGYVGGLVMARRGAEVPLVEEEERTYYRAA